MVTQMLFIYTLFKGHFCSLVVSLRFIVTYKQSPSKSLAGFLLKKLGGKHLFTLPCPSHGVKACSKENNERKGARRQISSLIRMSTIRLKSRTLDSIIYLWLLTKYQVRKEVKFSSCNFIQDYKKPLYSVT